MTTPWPVRRTERLYENRIFSVRADWCADPRAGPEAAEQPFWVIDSSDWVNVVARTEAGLYVMVAQWRFGSRSVSVEVPGGIVDPGERPVEAAARELTEETGYVAGRMVELGSVDPNPAILGNRLHVFAAEGCREAVGAERRERDRNEVIEVRLLSDTDVEREIMGGAIRHAAVMAAMMKYQIWKRASSAAD